jgi:hypothetical protein
VANAKSAQAQIKPASSESVQVKGLLKPGLCSQAVFSPLLLKGKAFKVMKIVGDLSEYFKGEL